MLEQQTLLLRPWSVSTDHPATCQGQGAAHVSSRRILDPTSRTLLGFAFLRPYTGRWWQSWFAPSVVAVHEAEDEPLVFTVYRHWGLTARWEVRDADEHHVGTLNGWQIRERASQSLASLERMPDRLGVRFRGVHGRELGVLQRAADGVELIFSAELDGEPFIKMLLLAAALVSNEF